MFVDAWNDAKTYNESVLFEREKITHLCIKEWGEAMNKVFF